MSALSSREQSIIVGDDVSIHAVHHVDYGMLYLTFPLR